MQEEGEKARVSSQCKSTGGSWSRAPRVVVPCWRWLCRRSRQEAESWERLPAQSALPSSSSSPRGVLGRDERPTGQIGREVTAPWSLLWEREVGSIHWSSLPPAGPVHPANLPTLPRRPQGPEESRCSKQGLLGFLGQDGRCHPTPALLGLWLACRAHLEGGTELVTEDRERGGRTW